MLYQAQIDLLAPHEGDHEADHDLHLEARERLLSWGLGNTDIDDIIDLGEPRGTHTIHAPQDGLIIHHELVSGQVFWPGDMLMQLADRSAIRIKASAYESDMPFIHSGMQASARLPYASHGEFEGQITHISPILNRHDRTAEVFIDIDWDGRSVMVNSFADVFIDIDLHNQLLIPEQSVIHSGDKRVVFIDKGEGKLEPRRIKTGRRNSDFIQVIEGLEEGDIVVTSGNFLLASESKLKSGLDQW